MNAGNPDNRLYCNYPNNIYETISCSFCGKDQDICLLCRQNKPNTPSTEGICKNYNRGCQQPVNLDNRSRHECECGFNDCKCLFESCSFVGTLFGLKRHLEQKHELQIKNSIDFWEVYDADNDRTTIVCCQDYVFRCRYFCYDDFVEFMMIPHAVTLDECWYRVSVNGKSKKRKCVHWNMAALDRGITFSKKELGNTWGLKFPARIKILIRS